MVGIFTSDLSAYDFQKKLCFFDSLNIKTKDLCFYCSDIIDNNMIVLKGNLIFLIEDVKKGKIKKIVVFNDDININDINKIMYVVKKYKISIIKI